MGKNKSGLSPVTCGVCYGSILGPLPLYLYMLPLGQIIHDNNITTVMQMTFRFTWLFVQITLVHQTHSVSVWSMQLDAIKLPSINSRQDINRLRLEFIDPIGMTPSGKFKIILFCSKMERINIATQLKSRGLERKIQIRNLGVLIHSSLSFSSHIKAAAKQLFITSNRYQESEI